MSKLKVVATVELTVPFKPVPWGVSGLAESIRTIRWGNWNSPERFVGQLVEVEVEVAIVEVGFTGRILVGGVVAGEVAGTLDGRVVLPKDVTLKVRLLGGGPLLVTADGGHEGQGVEAPVVLEVAGWLHVGQGLDEGHGVEGLVLLVPLA